MFHTDTASDPRIPYTSPKVVDTNNVHPVPPPNRKTPDINPGFNYLEIVRTLKHD